MIICLFTSNISMESCQIPNVSTPAIATRQTPLYSVAMPRRQSEPNTVIDSANSERVNSQSQENNTKVFLASDRVELITPQAPLVLLEPGRIQIKMSTQGLIKLSGDQRAVSPDGITHDIDGSYTSFRGK